MESKQFDFPLLMARTAGWGIENDAFQLCIQGSFYPATAFIFILPCGFWSFWNLDCCASQWSVKLLSIITWLLVLLSGSRGLKLKKKETLRWGATQWWGPLPDNSYTRHTYHDGRIPSPGPTPLSLHCLLMVEKHDQRDYTLLNLFMSSFWCKEAGSVARPLAFVAQLLPMCPGPHSSSR